MNLKKLVKLANHYDLKGEYAKADALDLFLKKASEDPEFLEKIKNENILSYEEAHSLFFQIDRKLAAIRASSWHSKVSFEEKLEKIKEMEGEMFKVFESGFDLSLSLIKTSLDILNNCKDKPENYFDTIKEQLFSKFAQMIISGLLAYQESGYSNDKSFGYNFVRRLAEMKDDSELNSAFVDYIINVDAITTIINSMKPSPDSSTIRREDDPTGRKLYRRLHEQGKPYAEGPESIYKIIEEKENPFYGDEEE
jgi:hypothetical protein